jgi:hypothetical protein
MRGVGEVSFLLVPGRAAPCANPHNGMRVGTGAREQLAVG